MGAIVTALATVPDPATIPAEARRQFVGIYRDLQDLGVAPPVTPADGVTRADLELVLRTAIGVIVKNEIDNDPRSLDYAGKTDAQIAAILNQPFVRAGKRLTINGTAAPVLETIAPLDATTLTVRRASGAAVDLAPYVSAVIGSQVVFTPNTVTVALRGVTALITDAGGNTLTLSDALPATPAVGDRLVLLDLAGGVASNRLHQILRRFPFAPNELTAADVAAARS